MRILFVFSLLLLFTSAFCQEDTACFKRFDREIHRHAARGHMTFSDEIVGLDTLVAPPNGLVHYTITVTAEGNNNKGGFSAEVVVRNDNGKYSIGYKRISTPWTATGPLKRASGDVVLVNNHVIVAVKGRDRVRVRWILAKQKNT